MKQTITETVPKPEKQVKREVRARAAIVPHLPKPDLIELQYEDLGRLNLDSYQRIKIGSAVEKIARSLEAGGQTPPIVLNRRKDGTDWIVDGQQRWWAAVQTKRPIWANVYALHRTMDGLSEMEAEEALFSIYNDVCRLSPDTTVNAWPGPVGVAIREWAVKEGSPYFNKIGLGRGGGKVYSAALLARAMCVVMHPARTIGLGNIRRILELADAAYVHEGNNERAEAIIRLIPLIFPPMTRARTIPVLAVAVVAQRRWKEGVQRHFPREPVWSRLRQLNWATLAPTLSTQNMPTIINAIEKRWRI
jgi:ParB-like nuclease domain